MVALPCFESFGKIFEVECDTFAVGLGGVLVQEGRPRAFLSEKSCHSRQKDSTYDIIFMVLFDVLSTGVTT